MRRKMLIDKIKELKVEALKERTLYGALHKQAYEAVLASIDRHKGSNITITDGYVIDMVKKEIKVFRESQSSDKQVLEDNEFKATVLEKLLPEQLTEQQLKGLLNEFAKGSEDFDAPSVITPKNFMAYLDEYCKYSGMYDKATVAKLVRGK